MSIKVEASDYEKAIFAITESKPYGVRDVIRHDFIDLATDQIETKLQLHTEKPLGYVHTEVFWLYTAHFDIQIGHWIGYEFCQFQEKSTGPLEEVYLGPFRVNLSQPDKNDVWLAIEQKTILSRKLNLYREWPTHEHSVLVLRAKSKCSSASDIKLAASHCPNCGSSVICAFFEDGMIDYYYNYHHICMDCNYHIEHVRKESNMGGGPLANGGDFDCHFCERRF